MHDYADVVSQLFSKSDCFTNQQFAWAAGISKQRASVILRRWVDTGKLSRHGESRTAKYSRFQPTEYALSSHYTPWTEISRVSKVSYIRVLDFGRRFRTRKQAREILDCVRHEFTIVDFRHVEEMTDGFVDELMRRGSSIVGTVVPINVKDAHWCLFERVKTLEPVRFY